MCGRSFRPFLAESNFNSTFELNYGQPNETQLRSSAAGKILL